MTGRMTTCLSFGSKGPSRRYLVSVLDCGDVRQNAATHGNLRQNAEKCGKRLLSGEMQMLPVFSIHGEHGKLSKSEVSLR